MADACSGRLISRDFLERAPATSLAPGSARDFRAICSAAATRLGPASHPAQIFVVLAAPMLDWLGWPRPRCSPADEPHHYCLAATQRDSVGLVVVPYGRARQESRAAVATAISAGARWTIVCDGLTWRLIDGLRGAIGGEFDFDIDACSSDERSLQWLLALTGPAAFAPASPSYLPRVLEASDAHGRRVCKSLRDGVSDALAAFTTAVVEAPGRRGLHACYAEALTAVYRTLFLLFAEARQLVPMWHPVYRRGYSMEAVRHRLARSLPVRGTWASLQAMARIAHAGADAGDLRVTPFNGRLFAPSRAPLLDHLSLDDRRVASALEALCFAPKAGSGGRHRIAYAELGVEELGSVYERLLDLQPISPGASDPAVPLQARTSRARKTTGTFYTPRNIADLLVQETLGPLVEGRTAGDVLALRVLDPAMGSGAFLVSAVRFLTAAWERALIDNGDATVDDVGEPDRAATRRTIALRCLFGVDRNPMAVQLAQLSLWLATLAADRPLSFLDHHLVAGNSLIGASPLEVLVRPPSRAPRHTRLPLESLFEWSGAIVSVRASRQHIEATMDDTAATVRAKESALDSVRNDSGLAAWRSACDLWCTGWMPGGPDRKLYHALLDVCLGRAVAHTPLCAIGHRLTTKALATGCFHWPLEFPEVFLDGDGRPRADGGFDAVIGNPPWEMLRADNRRESAAAEEADALVRFARDSGVYAWQGRGHANQFQLFVERAMQLARPGGRIGLVVPASVLTDEGSEALRRGLIEANRLDTVTVFDNRRALFPIHRSVRFAAVTAARHEPPGVIRCRFGVTDPARAAETPVVPMTPALIRRLSGSGLAVPIVPTAADLALVESITRMFPPLSDPSGWHVRFGRELNATDDRDSLHDGPRNAGDLPVVEGRHLSPFRVDVGAVRRFADRSAVTACLGGRDTFRKARLGYRDVASATNRTTLISAIVPANAITVHTVFCLRTPLPLDAQRVLCALLNSYVANYLARCHVTTHVTASIVSRLPVPLVPRGSPWFDELASASATLERGDDESTAASVQALAAVIYGLTEAGLTRVLSTFPLVEAARRDAVREAFVIRMQQRSC